MWSFHFRQVNCFIPYCLCIWFRVITPIVLLGSDSLGKTIGVACLCSEGPPLLPFWGALQWAVQTQPWLPGCSPEPRSPAGEEGMASLSQDSSRVTALPFGSLAQEGKWPLFSVLYRARSTVGLLWFLFWIRHQQTLWNDACHYSLFG